MKEQNKQAREVAHANITRLCDQLHIINKPFTKPKTLTMMDKTLINQRDMDLTTAGRYDCPQHVDLADLNLG